MGGCVSFCHSVATLINTPRSKIGRGILYPRAKLIATTLLCARPVTIQKKTYLAELDLGFFTSGLKSSSESAAALEDRLNLSNTLLTQPVNTFSTALISSSLAILPCATWL